ncbi:MAG: 6-carboxytetrahydropterin synthase [Bdellovibrionota bacterium]
MKVFSDGLNVNLSDIDRWMKEIVTIVDHKNLNELAEFQTTPPTPETIARFFFESLRKRCDAYTQPYSGQKMSLENVRVYEGDDIWADYHS